MTIDCFSSCVIDNKHFQSTEPQNDQARLGPYPEWDQIPLEADYIIHKYFEAADKATFLSSVGDRKYTLQKRLRDAMANPGAGTCGA